MIYTIYKDNRMIGYSTVPYFSSDEDEVVIPTSTIELEGLIGENWKEEYSKLILVDNEIKIDAK